MRASFVLLVGLYAGCSFTVSGLPPPTGADGGLDLLPADLAPHCVNVCADPSTLTLCPSATNPMSTQVTCAQGCVDAHGATPAHCKGLVPSGSVVVADYNTGTATTTLVADTTFDTDTGAISGGLTRPSGSGVQNGIYFHVVAQPGTNTKLGVFGFASLTVGVMATLHATGSNSLALAVGQSADIDGIIDLQGPCDGMTNGAGAGAGGNAAANGGGQGAGQGGRGQNGVSAGGGGGACGDNGGGGAGSNSTTPGGMLFGSLNSAPVAVVGGGGGGGGAGVNGGSGGAGGGALQLSVNGAIEINGTILASGCGGSPGIGGGGGGGAGGMVLVEGLTLTLNQGAVITASGGGGGGAGANATAGDDGQGTATAQGGMAGVNGTAGGIGGYAGLTAGANGAEITQGTITSGGGGGGGTGRISLKTGDGFDTDDGSTLVPALGDFNAAATSPTTLGSAALQ